ncbi:RDD family protein [Pedobacter sp. KR3-3]|uniref:RDD family protein n=1 Tax=Pedobacter albus TaxID=3113905 RepID=A0ABU7IC51_9SPHI|nr:RDD family protein [Pedobacter sp. KR3-3]MEE1946939.1 RDD family protein [Pedobacter sp. KR3-3]
MKPKIKYSPGRKALATIIDYTLIFGFSTWYLLAFGVEDEYGNKTISGLGALLPMLAWLLYFVIAEFYCSATLGHEIAKLKVVSLDGKKLGFGQVLVRRIADAIEIVPCFGVIAFFVSENNELGQRLGDMLAKTVVIGKNEAFTPVTRIYVPKDQINSED